jgi:hypothetical protein
MAGLAVALLYLKLSVTPLVLVSLGLPGGGCGSTAVTLNWDGKIEKVEVSGCNTWRTQTITLTDNNVTTPIYNDRMPLYPVGLKP